MPRSRAIEDYFEVPLAEIRPEVALPFELHLVFRANRHVVLWVRLEDSPTPEFLARNQGKGIRAVWLLKQDRPAWDAYRAGLPNSAPPLSPEEAAEVATAAETAKLAEQAAVAPPQEPRTEEGKEILAAMKDETLEQAVKEEAIAERARAVLAETAAARTLADQVAANAKAAEIVRDILEGFKDQAHADLQEIWKAADISADVEHAVNVSSFAVLFAMAFGRIDPGLLHDLAHAGLVHDVGVTQIPSTLSSIPWKAMSPAQLQVYAKHVELGLTLLKQHAPDTPERVRQIIQQHHEKFDGTGYPLGVKGFKVSDIAQLLAIADLLDSISAGQWDGVARTLADTFLALEKVEKARTFPEHFNPEVFAAVVAWIRKPEALTHKDEATEMVKGEAKDLLGGAAA